MISNTLKFKTGNRIESNPVLSELRSFEWVRVILGKNQLDYWILENPTNSKLEKWGCIPWIFYLLEIVL